MESLEYQLTLYKFLTSAIDKNDRDGETKQKLGLGGEVLTSSQFLSFMKRLTKSKYPFLLLFLIFVVSNS